MDKLKIIKTVVFILTFCTVFLLCLILTKLMVKSGQQDNFYIISLETGTREENYNLLSDGKRLYVAVGRKIHIISLADRTYEGVVVLNNGDKENGKEK